MLDKEFQLYQRDGTINQVVNKAKYNNGKIEGIEYLQKEGEIDVDCDRLLTDKDFKKINRMKRRKLIYK